MTLRESSKELLKVCVHNDTLFLTNLNVIDYSLLVGWDETHRELVVGIIDYIRAYTFDKVLENLVKGTLPGRDAPTIIPPNPYKLRFRLAMDRYFCVLPDRESHLPQMMTSTGERPPVRATNEEEKSNRDRKA
jgi:1-phosphatidylinositol-3-phosphate 5-kinase